MITLVVSTCQKSRFPPKSTLLPEHGHFRPFFVQGRPAHPANFQGPWLGVMKFSLCLPFGFVSRNQRGGLVSGGGAGFDTKTGGRGELPAHHAGNAMEPQTRSLHPCTTLPAVFVPQPPPRRIVRAKAAAHAAPGPAPPPARKKKLTAKQKGRLRRLAKRKGLPEPGPADPAAAEPPRKKARF